MSRSVLSPPRERLKRVLPPVKPLDRHARAALLVILVLGAMLRVGWALIAAEPPAGGDPDEIPRDPGFYLLLSDSLANGDGYSYPSAEDPSGFESTAYYPPGYPIVLGGVLRAVNVLPFDVSAFGVAVALNLVLSVATIALVFELARRLAGERVGLVAAALIALWPNLIVYSGVVLTETLFLFLLVALLLVALASPAVARSPGLWRMATIGVLLGAAGMVRPTLFVLAPLLLLLWWRAGVATAVWRTALVGLVALALVLPWTVRNAVQIDSPVLISTNFGDNFCVGHQPEATGAFGLPPYCFNGLVTPEPGESRPEFELRRQSETLARSRQYIREHPATVVTRMPAKLRYTLDTDADALDGATDYGQHELFSDSVMTGLRVASNVYYVPVMLAGLIGAVLFLRDDDTSRRRLFLVAASLSQLVPVLLTFGNARFKLPIYPAVAICAACVIVALADRYRANGGEVEERATAAAP